MQERMLHFLAGSGFPVLNLIQVLFADMQFLCQSALGITAGVPFGFQYFDKIHVIPFMFIPQIKKGIRP